MDHVVDCIGDEFHVKASRVKASRPASIPKELASTDPFQDGVAMADASSRAFGHAPSAGSASGAASKPPTGKAPEGPEMGDLSWSVPEADGLFSEIADGAEDVMADMCDAMGHVMGMGCDLPAQPEQGPDGHADDEDSEVDGGD
eukprot:3426826-Pyramimonas_sp.AAC.1